MEFLNDREEFKQRMENLDAEEMKVVVKVITDEMLVDELKRRLLFMSDKLNQIKEVLNVQEIE